MDYFKVNNIEEALSLLDAYGERGIVIGGGTLFVPHRTELYSEVEAVIDLERTQLDYINFDGNKLKIGATTKLASILTSEVICKGPFEVIAETVREITPPEVRNMATVAGDICISAEVDLPTTLIALGTEVVTRSTVGSRILPLEEFYLGYLQNALKVDEIVTELQVPYPGLRTGAAFLKFKRISTDLPLLNAAAKVTLGDNDKCIDVKIVLGVGTNTPIRVKSAEELLLSTRCDKELIAKAANSAGDIEYISDLRASAGLRKVWGKVGVKRVLWKALERAQYKEVS